VSAASGRPRLVAAEAVGGRGGWASPARAGAGWPSGCGLMNPAMPSVSFAAVALSFSIFGKRNQIQADGADAFALGTGSDDIAAAKPGFLRSIVASDGWMLSASWNRQIINKLDFSLSMLTRPCFGRLKWSFQSRKKS